MAVFSNANYAEIPTFALPSGVTVLTSTSNSTIILSILVSNRNGTAAADVTCFHTNASNVIRNFLGFTITVPSDANLDLIGNKYILPSGHKLLLNSSTSGFLDAAVSFVVV